MLTIALGVVLGLVLFYWGLPLIVVVVGGPLIAIAKAIASLFSFGRRHPAAALAALALLVYVVSHWHADSVTSQTLPQFDPSTAQEFVVPAHPVKPQTLPPVDPNTLQPVAPQ